MWTPNESVAAKRAVTLEVYQNDGVTPAPTNTVFTAVKASLVLAGIDTNVLASAVLTVLTAGAAGNSITLQFVADGSGAGSLTNIGSAYKVHFQSGVTTITNAIALLAAVCTFGGTFTGSNTLNSSGDVWGPSSFTGGQDSVVFLRPTGGAWATALGTLTNTGIVGHFEYVATQAETNVAAAAIDVRIGTGATFTIGAVTFNTAIENIEMRFGAFDNLGENSFTYGDLMRLLIGIESGTVGDFRTGTNVYKSLDTTKTRMTETTDASGRLTTSPGDLSGP